MFFVFVFCTFKTTANNNNKHDEETDPLSIRNKTTQRQLFLSVSFAKGVVQRLLVD
eukprot:m.29145 g.29145  ORF g.29145 m.29145 type:complete len:56 (-) comp10509_c0_seq1:1028-1195(-)